MCLAWMYSLKGGDRRIVPQTPGMTAQNGVKISLELGKNSHTEAPRDCREAASVQLAPCPRGCASSACHHLLPGLVGYGRSHRGSAKKRRCKIHAEPLGGYSYTIAGDRGEPPEPTMLKFYDRLTEYNVETDEEQIIETLTAILLDQVTDDLMLQNFYQDVPVSFKAAINRIEDNLVEVTAHKLQTRVMGIEKQTLIRSSHLIHPVIAQVRQLNTRTNVAELSQLAYAWVPSDRRRFVRVHLRENHTAVFKNSHFHLQATIWNISIGGVAVLSKQVEKIERGSRGLLHLDLGEVQADIPATLLRIRDKGDLKKYVFELQRGGEFEPEISRLISDRQDEILQELTAQ